MLDRLEVELSAYFLLPFFESVITKLNNFSAFNTHHVIVVLVAEDMLISDVPLAAHRLFDHPAIGQQRDQAIDGSQGDPFFPFLQTVIEGLDIEVLVEREDLAQDRPPLGGELQSLCPEIFGEFFFRYVHRNY